MDVAIDNLYSFKEANPIESEHVLCISQKEDVIHHLEASHQAPIQVTLLCRMRVLPLV